jgi:hypothetical protein
MACDIGDCTFALYDHWRLARKAPSPDVAELHLQLMVLYRAELAFLLLEAEDDSA